MRKGVAHRCPSAPAGSGLNPWIKSGAFSGASMGPADRGGAAEARLLARANALQSSPGPGAQVPAFRVSDEPELQRASTIPFSAAPSSSRCRQFQCIRPCRLRARFYAVARCDEVYPGARRVFDTKPIPPRQPHSFDLHDIDTRQVPPP